MPKKEVNAVFTEGQWKIVIKADDEPLTLRDQRTLSRAVLVATKIHLRQYNLKQRAKASKPTSTALKETSNV